MRQYAVRLGIVAGVVVGGVLTAVVAATEGPNGHVTVTISSPCRNAQPLIMGDHAWASYDLAPRQWGLGKERGTFKVVRLGEAVFRSDHDGRQITFLESENGFTKLECVG